MNLAIDLWRLRGPVISPVLLWADDTRGMAREAQKRAKAGFARSAGTTVRFHGVRAGMAKALQSPCPAFLEEFSDRTGKDLTALLTTRTRNGAEVVEPLGSGHLIHPIAPVDVPGDVEHFPDPWQPSLAGFAENERENLKAEPHGSWKHMQGSKQPAPFRKRRICLPIS